MPSTAQHPSLAELGHPGMQEKWGQCAPRMSYNTRTTTLEKRL